MAFFIFSKCNLSLLSLYKISENQSDLNNLNINLSDYKIIEDSQENFNAVKLKTKYVSNVNNDSIIYSNISIVFKNKQELQDYINMLNSGIYDFLNNNPNHQLYSRWNNFKDQLNNLNLNTITYPLNKSLEQYFNDLGQPSYNILQLP